jgi:hypothetical protein
MQGVFTTIIKSSLPPGRKAMAACWIANLLSMPIFILLAEAYFRADAGLNRFIAAIPIPFSGWSLLHRYILV